jgi:hypothetical protein
MNDEIFSDGIGEITVTGPTVRIDLVSLSPAERDAQGNPRAVFRQRIIMPLEAFMNARDLMERVAQELIESGAVTRRETAPKASDAAARRPSPNFS